MSAVEAQAGRAGRGDRELSAAQVEQESLEDEKRVKASLGEESDAHRGGRRAGDRRGSGAGQARTAQLCRRPGHRAGREANHAHAGNRSRADRRVRGQASMKRPAHWVGQGRQELDASLCFPLRQALLDVVTDAKLDTAAIDRQFADFLGTWDGSAELRDVLCEPGIPAAQKVGDSRQAEREAGHAEGAAQPDGRAHRQQSHRARGGSGRGLAQNFAGAAGHSPGGDCDGARTGQGTNARRWWPRWASWPGRKEWTPSFKLDKSILGGTVVRIGSTVYDGSVRGRLERLREELAG